MGSFRFQYTINRKLSYVSSYGGFFILTVQAAAALMQRPRQGRKIAGHRLPMASSLLYWGQ